MTTALPPAPPPLARDALEPWCVAGATGVLRLGTPPGGGIWLADGRITHAQSALTCGVTRLLTASGRLAPEGYRAAVASGDVASAFAGLTRRELQTVLTAACYSALHQLLRTRGEVRFELGVRHPLGGLFAADLPTATAEVDRRRAALDEAWPDDAVDSAPVSPVARIDGPVTPPSTLPWEIVVRANRRRTPYDIARLLGRDTYATLLAVRRMVRRGLIAPAEPRLAAATPPPHPELRLPAPAPAWRTNGMHTARITATPASVRRADATNPARNTANPPADGPSATASRGRRVPVPRPAPDTERLPHRAPREAGDRPASEMSDPERPAESWTENTLVRIRDALRALR